ncbi:MAG: NosD domain-containing protein [Euryarchaeota archaeon]|nr:NosD domain-containing protein [Euryarchaeota archaeon]
MKSGHNTRQNLPIVNVTDDPFNAIRSSTHACAASLNRSRQPDCKHWRRYDERQQKHQREWCSMVVVIAVAAMLAVSILPVLASALTCDCGDICVNTSGWWRHGGAFNGTGTPIQAAVDAASRGETICVGAGSYTENVHVNKRLTLRGEGADVVTVTAASASDHVFVVTADLVNLSGFYATTGTTSYKAAGIYGGGDHCIISDNNASGSYWGIYLSSSSNDNTLTNNTANSNGHGICLFSSSNNTLLNNTASNNNKHGIWLYSSCNHNTLTSNTASNNNKHGIWLYYSSNDNTLTSNTANSNNYNGIELSRSSNDNTLASNTADSNNYNGIGLATSSNNTLLNNIADSNSKGIKLASSSNNTLLNNTADSNNYCGIELSSSSNDILLKNTANSNNYYGIWLYYSSNNTLTSNIADSNDYGIHLDSSSNNTLLNNIADSNDYGIHLYSSSNNTLLNNTADSNSKGIKLASSSNNTLLNNIADSNDCGIHLDSSSNNTLLNNIAESNDYGIELASSSNNTIHNNYLNNTHNAYDNGSNTWNTTPTTGTNIIGGPWLGGNYWSDYAGSDTTNNGLGDTPTPYNSGISSGGDYHPLVRAAVIYTPPDPTTLANITGNFWVNHTWSAGSGKVTDSYNISINGVWYNITTDTFRNDTYTTHTWQNITVYAWNNSTGTLSTGSVSQNTQIPNNPVTITNISDWSGDAGETVYVDYDATDFDSDTPTFSCNRTDLFTDFSTATGQGNRTTAYTDSGVYYVDFGVSDGWGSTSNYTMTIMVNGTAPPVIHSVLLDLTRVAPNGSISVTVNVSAESGMASVTADGVLLEDAGNDTWTGMITAASTPGTYDVTVVATDASPNGNNVTDDSATYTVIEPVPLATLSIEDVAVRRGENKTVPITVFDVVDMGGCELNFTYDPTVVYVTDVARGDLNFSFEYNINNGSGWMRANALDVAGRSGNVIFAYVTLTAVGNKSDVSKMEFEDSRLINLSSGAIAHIRDNGTYSIPPNVLPEVTNASATPGTILYDNGRPKTPGTNTTLLNAQVTDADGDITTVTINLSSIGGLSNQSMEHVSGGVWGVNTCATEVDINATDFIHPLTITVTDDDGGINDSVSTELTVLKRGDVNGDGLVDNADADCISRYLAGLEPEASNPPGVLVGDVVGEAGDPMGNGVVDLMDALYIAKYTKGMVEAP